MAVHVANNCSQYTLQYWGPTMLADMFASSPAEIGRYIFAATLKTKQPNSVWVLAGVAIVMQSDA